jgi:hypothetical protein
MRAVAVRIEDIGASKIESQSEVIASSRFIRGHLPILRLEWYRFSKERLLQSKRSATANE